MDKTHRQTEAVLELCAVHCIRRNRVEHSPMMRTRQVSVLRRAKRRDWARAKAYGMSSAIEHTTAIVALECAAALLNTCFSYRMPPTRMDVPSTNSRLPITLPVSELFTSESKPRKIPKMPIISSVALPCVVQPTNKLGGNEPELKREEMCVWRRAQAIQKWHS